MAQPLRYNQERHQALADVLAGKVRYHNGLTVPIIGYRWSEEYGGGPFMPDRAEALQELWAADHLDVDTQLLACQGKGHAVRITHRGYVQLGLWNEQYELAESTVTSSGSSALREWRLAS